MQTAITNQTTLDNGLIVYSVHFVDGEKEWGEDFVYPCATALLRRLRRDNETRKDLTLATPRRVSGQVLAVVKCY